MEAIRKAQFILKGYNNFTKRSKQFPPITDDMTGKNFVITGANSGIGLAAAVQMAKLKANVYIVCRNEQRGKEALQTIKKDSGNQNVHLILGEMGDKKQMDQVAQDLIKKVQKIDIFVHNAGCMLHKKQFTAEKIEKNFAVNTFTIYYLTKLILPLLKSDSRIITVSSGGMLTEKLNAENLYMDKEKEFDGTTQYARNKRQQICIFEQFAKRYPDHGKFLSMHPGWVDTQAVREAMPDFHKKFKDSLKDQNQGSDTIIWLATCPFEKLKNGQFYYDREIAQKHLMVSGTTYTEKQVQCLMEALKILEQKKQ